MAGMFTNPGAQSSQGAAQSEAIQANMAQQNLMNALMGNYLNTASNPNATMTGAMWMIPSLSTGNVEDIQNMTQANMASHGFSQAPDLWSAALAKALGNAQVGMQGIGTSNYQTSQQLPMSVSIPKVSGYSQTQIPTPGGNIIGNALGGLAGGLGATAVLA